VHRYKPAASTVPITKLNAAGEEVTRLAYTHSYQSMLQISIPFASGEVPKGPTQDMLESSAAQKIPPALKKRFEELFEERATWTRFALENQLSDELYSKFNT
jgi:hypothetical protein